MGRIASGRGPRIIVCLSVVLATVDMIGERERVGGGGELRESNMWGGGGNLSKTTDKYLYFFFFPFFFLLPLVPFVITPGLTTTFSPSLAALIFSSSNNLLFTSIRF